jgi:hypothetical protein
VQICTSGSTVLFNELLWYLKAYAGEICNLNYGSVTLTIQEGVLFSAEIKKQHKRGKEIDASLFRES